MHRFSSPAAGSNARQIFLLCVFIPLLTSGCGGGMERIPHSGKVTLQSQPVEDGQIRFVPLAGVSAPLVVEPIQKGIYNTTTSGGLPVGKFRVEIYAWNPDDPAPQGPGAPARRQLIPEKFNTRSTMEISVEPEQSATTKDFELAM